MESPAVLQPPAQPEPVYTPPPPTPQNDYATYARQAAERAGIDPNIFYRQINKESGFDPRAVSSAGARGIAQILPQYHPGVDPNDPYASMDYAAKLMKLYYDRYKDWATALAAYNAGPGAVAEYGGPPPYEETQRYISAILGGGQ